jgi:hypothetical protein
MFRLAVASSVIVLALAVASCPGRQPSTSTANATGAQD